jgi:Cu+-exporting ATPase
VGIGRGAREGVLVRSAEALEALADCNALVVDKTGTLTEGRPRLEAVLPNPGFTEGGLLKIAASLEAGSEHPLAGAVLEGARARGIVPSKIEKFRALTGQGVTGTVDRTSAALGNDRLLATLKVDFYSTDAFRKTVDSLREDGQTAVYVVSDGKVAGVLGVKDPVKPGAKEALKALKGLGLEILMLTGDNETTARAVAKDLGIEQMIAGVSPDHKGEVVRQLKSRGKKVAMAGDGVNDAPALASADAGIAMGTGADVALESAGITLVKGDLDGIARAVVLSRHVMKNIRQNLFFAFVYNAVGVPLAAGVLYPALGLLLSPMIASAAMSLSSVSVIGNALRLKRTPLSN